MHDIEKRVNEIVSTKQCSNEVKEKVKKLLVDFISGVERPKEKKGGHEESPTSSKIINELTHPALKKVKLEPNASDINRILCKFHRSLLHEAIAESSSKEEMKNRCISLLKQGIRTDLTDSNERTAAEYAMDEGYEDIVLLIEEYERVRAKKCA